MVIRNMKFYKIFLVMIEVYVCREGFVFVINKYILIVIVIYVKCYYFEIDWKMLKLCFC